MSASMSKGKTQSLEPGAMTADLLPHAAGITWGRREIQMPPNTVRGFVPRVAFSSSPGSRVVYVFAPWRKPPSKHAASGFQLPAPLQPSSSGGEAFDRHAVFDKKRRKKMSNMVCWEC